MMDEILKEHLKEKNSGTYEAREMLHLNNYGTTGADKNFAGNMYLAALHEVAAQAAEIQRLRELIESIDGLVEEEMGEWYSVEFAHLPTRYANLAHIRDAISELVKEPS